jgi:hypothetical protein
MAESVERYWVYENWRARGHGAVIQRSACAFCRDGRGVKGGTRPDNGRWIGAFKSRDEAEAASRGTDASVRFCAFCS